MRKFIKLNQLGEAPLLLLVVVIGLIGFFLVGATFSFKSDLYSSLFPKKRSLAAEQPTINTPKPTPSVAPSLIGYWKFDEGQGLIVQDSSTSKLNAENQGNSVVWSNDCVISNCIQGASASATSKISLPYNSILNTPSNFTYNIWIKLSSNNPLFWATIMSRDYNKSFGIRIQKNANDLYFEWGTPPCDGTSYKGVSFGNNLIDQKWHMITATHDGVALKLYIDALLIKTYPISSFCSDTVSGLTFAENFPGSIDEAKLYNYALNETDISLEYSITNSSSAKR